MKTWTSAGAVLLGLIVGCGCSRDDADRARRESHDAQEKAERRLEETRDKLREELKRADQQTREDLDKARDQLHHALNQSERDADKARDRLRQREDDRKTGDSHP